jgi:predicted lipoprotein with Yx(FWY)xxD motif
MQAIKVSDIYMAVAVTALAAFAGQAGADSRVLTDKAGMTVYIFDKDSAGKSACYGDCAAAWPPVPADSLAAGADVSVIARDDGGNQAAIKGKPLYLFSGDKKPGDVKGDNVQNVWHALSADGKPINAARKSDSSSGYSYGY